MRSREGVASRGGRMKTTYHMLAKDSRGRTAYVDVAIDFDGLLQYLANRAANARPLDSRKKAESQQARLAGGLAVATVVPKHKQEV